MKVLKVFMKPFRTFFRLKEMGKLSVQKGSAERSERFFSGLPLMYDLSGKKNVYSRIRTRAVESECPYTTEHTTAALLL